MQKIKEIYNNSIQYLKNLSSIQKKYIGLALVLVVLLGVVFQIVSVRSKTDKTELATDIDSAIAYLKEAQEIKTKFIEKKMYQADYDKREKEIEIAVEEIVERFQTMKFKDDVKIDRNNLISTGGALQVLLYVMHNSNDLKNLNDEILALNIILEEIKTEI